MKKILALVLTLSIVLSALLPAFPQIQAAESWDVDGDATLSILAIGDEGSIDSMEYAWNIADDLGISKIVLGNLYVEDGSIAEHWVNADNDKAVYTYRINTDGSWSESGSYKMSTALMSRSWDYVSLQQSGDESGNESSYNTDLTSLVDYIGSKCPDAELVWNMTWAYREGSNELLNSDYADQEDMYLDIASAVMSKIATNSDFSKIIPIGSAVENIRTSLVGDIVCADDGRRLEEHLGRFLAGLTLVQGITGLDIWQCEWTPENVPFAWQVISMESASNATEHPFAITTSQHTDPETSLLYDTENTDAASGNPDYARIFPKWTIGGYWFCTSDTPDTPVTAANNSPYYWCTPRYTRSNLPVGSIVQVSSGYKYRFEGWKTSGTNTRGPIKTGSYTVTAADWSGYRYRGFNVSSTTADVNITSKSIEDMDEIFRIYYPVGASKLNNAAKYVRCRYSFEREQYWHATHSSYWNERVTEFMESRATQYICTPQYTREQLPVGSIIYIDDAWRYRPDCWNGEACWTEVRPHMIHENYTQISSDFWTDVTKRAFNVSRDDVDYVSNYTDEEILNCFRIYIPASAHTHSYDTSTKEPTCYAAGTKNYSCTTCYHSYSEVIAKSAHPGSVDFPAVAPTCTTDGLTAGTKCSVDACGAIINAQIVAALGHSYSEEHLCTRCGIRELASGNCGENATWEMDLSTGCLTISGTGDMTDYTSAEDAQAPWSAYGDLLKTVIVEDGISSIGAQAFASCEALETVTIFSKNCNFAEDAGAFGPNSPKIIAPQDATALDYAEQWGYDSEIYVDCSAGFHNDDKTLVSSPTCSTDGQWKWKCKECNRTTYKSIPMTGHSFVDGYCTACGQAQVVSGSCGADANYTLDLETGIMCIEGTGVIEGDAWWEYQEFIRDVRILEGITSTGWISFSSCDHLTNLVLPDSLEQIGYLAVFLEELRIPKNLSMIDPYAFFDCSIGRFVVDEDNSYFTADERGILFSKDMSTLIKYPAGGSETEYTVPEGVSVISDGAFRYSSLQKVGLPSTLTMLGMDAFSHSENLSEVKLPYGVEEIDSFAFSGCTALTSITIPESVNIIGAESFANCSSLQEVIIEHGVEYIDRNAFSKCIALQSIIIPGSIRRISNNPFEGCSSLTELILEEGMEYIDAELLDGTVNVKSLTIPSTVVQISEYAFTGSKLESLTILNPECILPEDSTSLGDCDKTVLYGYVGSTVQAHAEKYGYQFKAITDCDIGFHNYIETVEQALGCLQDGISVYTCEGCGDSYEINTPQLGHTYGENHMCVRCGVHEFVSGTCGEFAAWELDLATGHLTISGTGAIINYTTSEKTQAPWIVYSDLLKTVTVEDGIESIGNYSFHMCENITTVNLPESLTSINDYAFRGCAGLTSITLPKSVTSIGTRAFSLCSALTSIVIPEGVTSIGSYAFYNCSALTSVVIPEGVTSIESNTFYNCSALTSIVIPNGVTSIESSAFYNCSALTSVVIPESVTSIASGAFRGCTALKELAILNPTCKIYGQANVLGSSDTTVLYGLENSTTQTYAETYGYEFRIYVDCANGYHDYVGSVKEPAGCLHDGVMEYRCSGCEDSYDEPISPLGHETVKDPAVAPTCTETGLTAGTHCGRCGMIFEAQQEVAALGHSFRYAFVDQVNHRKYCTACDYEKLLVHTWTAGSVTTNPTCTETGIRTYNCFNCAVKRAESIASLGHVEIAVEALAPTCTEDGFKSGTRCSRCKEILSGVEMIPATGHSYETQIIAPTYLKEGYTIYTCSVCDDSYTGDFTSPLPRTSIEEAEIELEFESAYYEGKAVCPKVFIRYNAEEYDASQELRVTYFNNNRVGTASVQVTGINRFEGTRTLTFELSYEVIPQQIVNLIAVGEIGKIALSWSISAEVDTDTYRIYRKSEKEDAFTLLKTINGRGVLYYTDATVERDVNYSYYVTGVGLYGAESEPSITVTAMPAIDRESPVVTKVLPDSSARIRGSVGFGANATDNVGVTTLTVEYSRDQIGWIELGSCAYGKKVSMNTSDVSDGIVYIRVYAKDAEGNESAPLRRAYYIDNTAPEQVQALEAEVVYSSKLTLRWNDVADDDRTAFVVQMEKAAGWTTLATVDELGYNVSGLNPDVEYSFRVAAKDQCGNIGAWSEPFAVRTLADVTAPSITGHSPLGCRVKDGLSFKVTAQDECGVSAIEIFASVDLKNWSALSKKSYESSAQFRSYTYAVPLSQYSEGEIYLCAVAYDYSGNESAEPADAIKSSYYIDRTAPSAPQGLVATGNNGYITVEWQDVTEEDRGSFTLYRATSESGPYTTLASNYNYRSYHDRNVQPDTLYYYKVCVSDQCGNMSAKSAAVQGIMATDTIKPEIVSFSRTYEQRVSKSYNEITVLANDNSRLNRLVAEYKTDAQEEYAPLGSATNINDYSKKLSLKLPVEDLADGTVITVRAYAVDAVGLISDYATASYTVDHRAPAVEKLTATLSGNSIQLSWNDDGQSDISGFRIYRSTNGNSFTSVGSRSYKETGYYSYTDNFSGDAAATFRYRITAIDSLGNCANFYTSTLQYTPVTENQPPVAKVTVPKVMEIGVEQYLDATASTDDGLIVSYHWDFGDGTTADDAKTVKKYTADGTYTVTLTLTDDSGLVTVETYSVNVRERTLLGTLNIKVIDGENRALPGAMVCIDNGTENEITTYANSKGIATVQLETGEHDIAVFMDQHHLPARKTATVLSNTTRDITLILVEEEIVTGDFEIERMDLDEIKAAGIDIYDEANHNIYQVSVRVTYSGRDYNMTYTRDDSKVLTYQIVDSNGKAVERVKDSSGNDRVLTPIVVPSTSGDIVAILDVPVRAQFLKEFFDVKLHITNHAAEEFVLVDNMVTLSVPEGMTLMENLNGFLSKPVYEFASLKGQESTVLRWCLRGDVEGDYYLSANYFGVMEFFNKPISATFKSEEPIKVYGMGGVGLNLLFAQQDSDGILYFSVGLENQRDVDLYMPGIKVESMLNDVAAVAELRNNGNSEFGIPTLLNIYLQEDGNRRSLPAIYDVNGELMAGIDTLKPGQELIYEYMCYCSVADNSHAYFKDAAVSVFSGVAQNVHVGTYTREGISIQNYSGKLDRILSNDDEARQFREAYQHIATDKNYYYYYQGANLSANIFEELYQIADGFLTMDVGNFTNEDKEALVESYLYDTIMTISNPSAEQVMIGNVELLVYEILKDAKPLLISELGTSVFEGKNLDTILKIAAEDLAVLVNVLNNQGFEAFLTKLGDIVQGRLITLGVTASVVAIFESFSLNPDYFAYIAPGLQEVYGLIKAANDAKKVYETKQLLNSAMRASASFAAQEGVVTALLNYIDDYSGGNREITGIMEDVLEEILAVIEEEKSGKNYDWLRSFGAAAGEFTEEALSATLKSAVSYLAKVKNIAWASRFNKISLGWKLADLIFGLGQKALQQGTMDAFVGISTVFLGTFKELLYGQRTKNTDLSAYYILSMLADLRLTAERQYKNGVCAYMKGGILPKTEAKALEVINDVKDTEYTKVDHWFDDVRYDIVWSKWILFNMDIPDSPNGVTVSVVTNSDASGIIVYNRFGRTPLEGVDVELVRIDLNTGEHMEPICKKTDVSGIVEIPSDGETYVITLSMDGFRTKEHTIVAAPNQLSTVFLCPKVEKPTVFAVEYQAANASISKDILSNKVVLSENDSGTFDLTVYGDYNGPIKEYWLIQGGKVIMRDSGGKFKGLTPKSFGFGKELYAAVVGADGVVGDYAPLQFSVVESFKPDDDDFCLTLGNVVKLQLPSECPIVGGMEFEFDLSDLPVYAEIHEDTIKVAVNMLKVDKDGEVTTGLNYGQTAFGQDTFWNAFKNSVRKRTDLDKFLQTLNEIQTGMLKTGKAMKLGDNKLDFDVWGYLEGNAITGEVSGEIAITLNAKISNEYQLTLGIPITVSFEVHGKVDTSLEASINMLSWSDLKLSGTLKLSAGFTVGVGPGFAKVASLTVNGGGEVGLEHTLDHEVGSYFRSWLRAYMFIKVKALFAELKIDITEKEWTLAESTTPKKGTSRSPMENLMDLSNYSIASRDYLEEMGQWTGGRAKRSEANVLLQDSIYDDTRLNIVESGGKKVMFFLADDPTRSDLHRTVLVYSVYDDASNIWSKPVAVEDDGTADFTPVAVCDGEDVYVVWSDLKAEANEEMTMSDISAMLELKYAKLDIMTGTTNVHTVTEDNYADLVPQASVVDGALCILWSKNRNNNLLGNDSENVLYLYTTDTKEVVCLDENVSNVVEMAVGTAQEQPVYAYITDKDGDYNTYEDREMLISYADGTEVKILEASQISGLATFRGYLIWCEEGSIKILGNSGEVETFFDEALINGSYKLYETEEKIYLLTLSSIRLDNGDAGSELFAYVYDKACDSWGGAVQLSHMGKTVKDFGAFSDNEGTLRAVLTVSDITESDASFAESAALYMIKGDASANYVLTALYSDPESRTENGYKIGFTATVKNQSIVDGGPCVLSLRRNGTEIASYAVDADLLAGQSCEISGEFDVREIAEENERLTVCICDRATGEAYETAGEIVVGQDNVSVAYTGHGISEDFYVINTTLENNGSFEEDLVFEVRADGPEGTLLQSHLLAADAYSKYPVVTEVDASKLSFEDAGMNIYLVVRSADSSEILSWTYFVVYPPHVHTQVQLPAVDGSCTQDAKTEGLWCEICGTVFVQQEITPAPGHACETWETTKEATCREEGEESSVCTVCGETVIRATEKLSHEDGEWRVAQDATPEQEGLKELYCKNCDTVMQTECIPMLPTPKFKSVALTLQDDLTMNFKVQQAFLEENGYTDPYVVCMFNGQQTILREYTVTNGLLSFDFENVIPHQMNDLVRATLYVTYNGEEYASKPLKYGVVTYCYNMLNKLDPQVYGELCTLLVDLLNYGAASQKYMHYNTDNLVNANLTEAQKALGTKVDRTLTTVQNTAYKTIPNPTVKWKSVGLNLQKSVGMRFKIAADSIGGLCVKVESTIGTWYIPAKEFVETDGGWYVYVKGMNAAQMSEPVYVTVYKGNTVVSNTLSYSIESYAYSKQNNADVQLAELVKAMMRYGDSAKAFLN